MAALIALLKWHEFCRYSLGEIDRDGEGGDMGTKKLLLVSVVTAVTSVAVLVASAYAGIVDGINKVPEPGTLVLLSAGAGGALAWRWFRKRR